MEPGPARVLVVDDCEPGVAALARQLHRAGYHVITALSGEEALRRLSDEHPDLILTDIMMPGIDGIELCRRVKQSPETRDLPVILMSALDSRAQVIAGLDAGACDYITKPYDWPTVAARLRSAIRAKRAYDALRDLNEQLEVARQDAVTSAEALCASKRDYQGIFESSPDAIFILDPQSGEFLDVNRAACQLFGYDRAALLNQNIAALSAGDDIYTAEEAARRLAEVVSDGALDIEWHARRRSGELFWVEARATPVEIAGQASILAFVRDITERKRAALRIQESEERLQTILDSVQFGVLIVDPETQVVTDANAAALDMIGVSREAVVGRACHEHICPPPLGQGSIIDPVHDIERTERELLTGDGRRIPVLKTVAPIVLDGHRRLLESFVDITDRLAAEAAVRGKEQLLWATLESTADGILVVDQRGQVTHWNTRFRDLWRVPSVLLETRDGDALLRHMREQLLAPETMPAGAMERYDAGPATAEVLRLRDGRVLERCCYPLQPQGDLSGDVANARVLNGQVWSFRDVTARIHAEQALRESQQRFERAIRGTSDGIWEWDLTTDVVWFAPRFKEMLGYETLEFPDTYDAWVDHVHPDDRTMVLAAIHSHLADGRPYDIDYRMRTKSGTYRWTHARGTRFCDENGRPVRMAGSNQDISDRKHAEDALRRNNEALASAVLREKRVAARLEATLEELEVATSRAEAASRAKSEFLANTSHEVRTPLNGIVGVVDLLRQTDLSDRQRRYVDIMEQSAKDLSSIINDILDLSKIEAGKLELDPHEFALRAFIDETLRPYVLRAGEKGLRLEDRLTPNLPAAVVGDAGRLRQVLVNLVGNAIKFTRRGHIRVGVALDSADEQEVTLHFSVEDTGIGIPPDKLDVIFEAFAQADGSVTRQYGGTGLGLSITSQLVTLMHGRIWVDSTLDHGSTFHFTVRLGRSESHEVPAADRDLITPSPVRRASAGLNILLVEDNATNQEVVSALLETDQHTVTVAGNGAEAVAAFSRAVQQPFDIVLMDVQMPVMGGFEATATIRHLELNSGHRTPIVAMTAGAMKGDRERCLMAGMDDYVAKPVTADTLRRVLARWASQPPAEPAATAPAAPPAPDDPDDQTTPPPAPELTAPDDESAAAAGPPPMDIAAALVNLDGNTRILERVVARLREELPRLLAELRSAVSASDAAQTRILAHSIKGATANVCAERSRHLAYLIETAAEGGAMEPAVTMLPEIEREVQRLLVFLAMTEIDRPVAEPVD